ncbi:MAG: Gfo/Idh/MocA family oxidoreductase [Clostridiales bacterium]|nr:Gfo/Idh/MocA family oxidoreductase [Clostridiales bacterium]
MLNIALIGTWHVHFDGYARHAAGREDCRITALWDCEEGAGRAVAEKYGCDFIADYDELLKRKDVDAVMVCTSTDMHKDVIIKAANAGKHIFTEKVLCFNKADAVQVSQAVKNSGVKFCISFPWRSRGDFLWIKQAVDSGLIGKVNYIRMRNAHNGVTSGWLPETFFDKEKCGGGAMMDLGAHSMYFLNWIMGRPLKASSAFTNVRIDSVEDNAVTVLTYEGGAVGVSETAFVSEHCPFELEVVGDKGTILSGGFMDKTCYNTGDGWVFPKVLPSKPEPLDMWVDGILKGSEIPYTIEDAVSLSETMEMAYANII